MNDDELKELQSLKDKKKLEYFYTLWTYKESLTKLRGKGLYLDLKGITNFKNVNSNITKYSTLILEKYCLTAVISY